MGVSGLGESTAAATTAETADRGPRHHHRAILSGMLWVVRTDASRREMPGGFGKWETAYRRYRLWLAQGLWQRIESTLSIEGATPSAR